MREDRRSIKIERRRMTIKQKKEEPPGSTRQRRRLLREYVQGFQDSWIIGWSTSVSLVFLRFNSLVFLSISKIFSLLSQRIYLKGVLSFSLNLAADLILWQFPSYYVPFLEIIWKNHEEVTGLPLESTRNRREDYSSSKPRSKG